MKAVILAAGKGERLKGVVDSLPKPMVAVNGRPILEQNIELLRISGITELFINLHHLPDAISGYFRDGGDWGVSITYSHEPAILGTAGAVRKLAGQLKGERFLVLYGDNLYDCDLADVVAFHGRKEGLGTIGLYEKEDVSQSGVVELGGDGRITGFIEKPGVSPVASRLVNAGVYVFEPEILAHIPRRRFCDFGYDVFPRLIAGKKCLYGALLKGGLTAIDTPEFYHQAIRGFA